MSIKSLFDKLNIKILPSTNLNDVSVNVESSRFVNAVATEQETINPIVDYSFPDNFCRFGSAKKYYLDSINRILTQYPYDSSQARIKEFLNSGSYLDNYILENEYPRTNGYARFSPTGWGIQLANSIENFGQSDVNEYIQTKGVMNVVTSEDYYGINNLYNTGSNRTANLKINGSTGNTVEFWLKKGAINVAKTSKEVIFDLWNGTTVSHAVGSTYGRFIIFFDGTVVDPNPVIKITYVSGTVSTCTAQILGSTDGNADNGTLLNNIWNHYAITVKNVGSNLELKLFLNGSLNNTTTVAAAAILEVTGSLISNIGALRTKASTADNAAQGYGKLSGSLDDFRFWKVARTDKEIYENWFCQVGGGTNTDTANTNLGLYYKFNEGITTNSSTDAVVLDYSGRISNGTWTGYASDHRATGSAMIESGYAIKEFKDPIVRVIHPDIVSYSNLKSESGSLYDFQNVGSLEKYVPAWIIEEDATDDNKGNLQNLLQIMASYFDTLYLQLDQLPKLTEARYVSGSLKPLSLASRLLSSRGFIVPEIFADADIMEIIANKDDRRVFEEKLYVVKNLIYQNIYNNLTYILKSKGTEKSFRNLIRCFGIDDELIKINMYASNMDYELKDNVRYTSFKKKYIDFNNVDRFNSTIYQYTSSGNANSVGYVSSSYQLYEGTGSALTTEVDVWLPKKFTSSDINYFETPFVSASIFGVHTVNTGNLDDTSWKSPDVANFQVYVVRDKIDSKDGYFKLTGSSGGYFPLITSSLITNLYNNNRWMLSVKIVPSKYPLVGYVSGTLFSNYNVSFLGFNTVSNQIVNSFSLSSSITSSGGSAFQSSAKRFYIGAHRTNFTGSVRDRTDVKIGSLRCWYDELSFNTILNHAQDASNFGTEHPYESNYLNFVPLRGIYIPKIDNLFLYWNFQNVTGSNSSGRFVVEDMSSGSVNLRTRYGWYSNIVNNQHTGRGDFFPTLETGSVDFEYIYNAKNKLPGYITSNDMINILSSDDVLFTRDTRPINFSTAFEKSMYQTISEEMVNWFGTIKDFNNLIGEPVNYYRQNYKELGKLRQLFFEKVNNTPDFEKFLEYFKWVDQSISVFLSQLIPATSNISPEIQNMVESHILERNKYWNKFPTLEFKKGDPPEIGIEGINKLLYNWKYGHAPPNSDVKAGCYYWKNRRERNTVPLSVNNNIDISRNLILSSTFSAVRRSFTTPIKFSADLITKSDINLKPDYTIPTFRFKRPLQSGITILSESLSMDPVCTDYNDLNSKKKLIFKAHDIAIGTASYAEAKSDLMVPFEMFSSSIKTGYAQNLSNNFRVGVNIVGLHNDLYTNDAPLQGPFTEKYVGGKQYRHYSNIGGNVTNRPEGFRIYTTNNSLYIQGADTTSSLNFTNISPRAYYYRDGLAKRPLNIKNILSGNYNFGYEIIQTSGRFYNNKDFVMSGGFTLSSSVSPFLFGQSDYLKPIRGKWKNVIVEKFSAPGSPEVEASLDAYSGEYSIYNTTNYRNLIVRNALNTLYSRPCGRFGTDSLVGSVNSLTYESSASYHKINNNSLTRNILSGTSSTITTSSIIYDNWSIIHPIPQDEASLSWVMASSYLSGSTVGD